MAARKPPPSLGVSKGKFSVIYLSFFFGAGLAFFILQVTLSLFFHFFFAKKEEKKNLLAF